MSDLVSSDPLSPNDNRLIEEALRRLERSASEPRLDRSALISVLAREIHRGRRDVFSLVRAGQRALDNR